MRHALFVAVALSSSVAFADGPVGRVGVVGGYDQSAPAHREDGLATAVGYRMGPWTGGAEYSYLEYDGSSGVGGGAHRAGLFVQHSIYQAKCEQGTCPHVDFDLGAGYRWVNWNFDQTGVGVIAQPVSFKGREVQIGLSADFFMHIALHYVVFDPEGDTMEVACRSTRGCGQTLPSIGHAGLMLEASFALGGS
jgi:hypothetical protein